VKNDTVNYASGELFSIGTANGSQMVGLRFNSTDTIRSYFYSNDVVFNVEGNSDRWLHVVSTYDGGSTVASRKLYVNGEECSIESTAGTIGALNLQATSHTYYVSRAIWSGSQQKLKGYHGGLRVYNKVLSIDQIKELYDWQKDHFLGSRSSMTLYRGNLGLGVAEPTSRLEIAGNERIQEYPPRAMTSGENYMEGYGVFKARWSNWYDGNTRWGMYNKKMPSATKQIYGTARIRVTMGTVEETYIVDLILPLRRRAGYTWTT
jgi:hypothetical protein